MNLQKITALSVLVPYLLLAGCNWFDDDNTAVVLTGKGVISAQHTYVAGGEDDYNEVINTTNVSSASKVSVLLSVDESAEMVGHSGTNGYLEVEVNLTFQESGNTGTDNALIATMRLVQDNTGSMIAQHRATKVGLGSISERLSTAINWHEPTTLSIEWKEAEQKFTFTANTSSWDIHKSDLVNLSAETAEAFTFDASSFKEVSLITTVRNMDVVGESGSLKVNIDEVSIDGVIYDDFNSSNVIDTTKWERESFTF